MNCYDENLPILVGIPATVTDLQLKYKNAVIRAVEQIHENAKSLTVACMDESVVAQLPSARPQLATLKILYDSESSIILLDEYDD